MNWALDVDAMHQQPQSFLRVCIRTKSDQLNMLLFGHNFLVFGIFLLIIDIRNRVSSGFGNREILFAASAAAYFLRKDCASH